jgi:hypothetical protein
MERFFTDQHIEIRFGMQMTRNEAISKGCVPAWAWGSYPRLPLNWNWKPGV